MFLRIRPDRTLLVFHSDNGGPTAGNTSRNTPLRGFKAQVYEGGIRVPFLMQLPGKIPKGKTYSNPVIALDLLPTFVAAAGAAPAADWKCDGVNQLPFQTGQDKGAPHARLYWRFGQQWAIREGDWKLLSMGTAPALYNLKADIGEASDLSASEKVRVESLAAAWETWNKNNIPAKWTPQQRRGQKQKKKKRA